MLAPHTRNRAVHDAVAAYRHCAEHLGDVLQKAIALLWCQRAGGRHDGIELRVGERERRHVSPAGAQGGGTPRRKGNDSPTHLGTGR